MTEPQDNDDRFDESMTSALEALVLAINRYLLRRDAYLMTFDAATKERKFDELRAMHYSLSVQIEYILTKLLKGKL